MSRSELVDSWRRNNPIRSPYLRCWLPLYILRHNTFHFMINICLKSCFIYKFRPQGPPSSWSHLQQLRPPVVLSRRYIETIYIISFIISSCQLLLNSQSYRRLPRRYPSSRLRCPGDIRQLRRYFHQRLKLVLMQLSTLNCWFQIYKFTVKKQKWKLRITTMQVIRASASVHIRIT